MKRLGHVIGPVIGVAGLVWVLHDIHLSVALQHIAGIQWRYVVLAIGIDFFGMFLQGVRWVVILRPVASVRPFVAFNALLIGLFTNTFLPLRAGELVRVYVLAQEGQIDKVVGFASILEERILDGTVLALLIVLLVAFHFPLPGWMREAGVFLVGILLIGSLMIFVLGFSGHLIERSAASDRFHRLLRPFLRFFGRFGRRLADLYRPQAILKAFFLSGVFWLVQGMVIYTMFFAYNLSLPFLAAMTVLLVINMGIMIPNTPGNVGTYQLFCVLGLSLYRIEKTTAAGFSVVMFIFLTLPVLIAGFGAVIQGGFSLTKLRAGAKATTMKLKL